ncbi:MAG: zinc ribbon domain-containing protein [Anaerolineales bacterium]|nr:zinc ribbon domain-containing protein [Anaerolineales bacterium]
MPVYTYRCDNCGHEFDRQQSFDDSPLKVCPECRKHTLHKVYRAAGVVFKGSGFYVTDKSRKSASPAPTNGKKAKEPASTNSTTSTAETKSEKPAAKPKSDE